MKPFLGIDLTTDKKNDRPNGAEFLVAKTSPALSRSFEQSSENAEETIEQSRLPLPLRIGQWICGAVGLVVALGLVKGLGGENDVSLSQAYQNAPWLFWLAGGSLLAFAVLKLIGRRKEKTVLATEESAHTLRKFEGVCDAIYSELAVPSDAKEVDLLSFFYKVKDGSIKVCERPMQLWSHFNPVFKVFADSEQLYFANTEGKYAFPRSSLKAIHTLEKRVRVMGWNKTVAYNEGVYKQYKLTSDQYGCIHCKLSYILEIDRNGEPWGIHIPCYELPAFEELTGLKAQQK